MILTYNFIKFSQSQTQGIWSVWTACRIHTNSLTIESRRFHFGFVTLVPIFVKEKYDPAERKRGKNTDDNKLTVDT